MKYDLQKIAEVEGIIDIAHLETTPMDRLKNKDRFKEVKSEDLATKFEDQETGYEIVAINGTGDYSILYDETESSTLDEFA